MCGRFALTISPEVLARLFGLADTVGLENSYNICPGQEIAAITRDNETNANRLIRMRWGLSVFADADPRSVTHQINARAETAFFKLKTKSAFLYQRCLIPASGFYEWKRQDNARQPYYFAGASGQPLFFAGLWGSRLRPDHPAPHLFGCAILTRSANGTVQPVHNRMPLILGPDHFDLWLEQGWDRKEVARLLEAPPEAELTCHPVSPAVNRTNYNRPDCIEPRPDLGRPPATLFDL